MGLVTASFAEGSIIAKNAQGKLFRLAWDRQDKDRRRALPAGTYTLTHYQLVRRDSQDKAWFLAATSHGFGRLVVRAGQEQAVKVKEAVSLKWKVHAAGGSLDMNMVLHGEHHAGVSLYKDGKRIAARYRVTDAEDKELAAGLLEYG